MTTHSLSLAIIGSGAAGYTAAIYAARANLKPVVFAGEAPGGQLTITTDVENYPGFAAPIQGPWLMEQMRQQAEHVGTEIIYETIDAVDFSDPNAHRLTSSSGTIYTAPAVIVATGAQAKWLGAKGEETFRGFGVSACATCDGFFFKDQNVAIVGGGNTAVEEALYLTHHAAKVTLIHRRDTLKAEKILQDRLRKNPKVSFIWDTEVMEIEGETTPTPMLKSLRLKNLKTGVESTLTVDGFFVAIGHQPATKIFEGKLPTDKAGYLKRHPDSSRTDIAGVFVAGDVCDPIYRQAVTAAGMGCMAALDAERYLAEHFS
ncbi:MAG: thioredoxin-disulfide reductase [Holosporales bacterium]|jgi:thioredoxin reductase (NADPH)